MFRTCKIKLGKAPKQEEKLEKALELCRELYNAALEQRIVAWKNNKRNLTYMDQCKDLTDLRNDDERFADLHVTMVRLTALDRLDKAYSRSFKKIKAGKRPGFPRYRGQGRFSTIIFDDRGWKIEGKYLRLYFKSGYLYFKMKNDLYLNGNIVRLSLVKKSGRWWAHFLVDVGPAPELKKSNNAVGIDVGLKSFATLSDGVVIDHPHFIRTYEAKIRKAQSECDMKIRGSKNHKKALIRYERLNEKLVNSRRNFIYQLVASLVKKYDGFAVEKLKVEGMVSLGRDIPEGMNWHSMRAMHINIMDSSWTMFCNHLANKAEEAGYPVLRVDPKGTTQRCSGCGEIVRKNLRTRTHECSACGLILDRDLNAAKNILKAAIDLGWRSASKTGAEELEFSDSAPTTRFGVLSAIS